MESDDLTRNIQGGSHMKPRRFLLVQYISLGILLMAAPALSVAATVTYLFNDPIGDNATTIDLVGMDFVFDNITADYTVTMRTTPTNPFLGQFRLNVNIFNPDTGTTVQNPALFQDTLNDFSLVTPLTEIVLTGTNTRLLSWSPDDNIAVSTEDGLGNPDGSTYFATAVYRFDGLGTDGLPGCNEDFIAPGMLFSECSAAVVPIPAAAWLFGSGLLGLVGIARHKKA